MQTRRFILPLFALAITFCITAVAQDSRHIKVLHSFSVASTGNPGNLLQDSAGNFYGTTNWGGRLTQCGGDGCGGVFRLSPSGSGWTYTVLYEFATSQGAEPGTLVIDSAGNLYGVFSQGGTYGAGAVFELSPTTSGPWTYTNLYTFTGEADGNLPNGYLAWDGSGNLYGMTDFGGTVGGGYGTVFKLSPNGSGGWNFSSQYSFDTTYGHPSGALLFDADGNAYGVSTAANSQGPGAVFELSPGAGGWTLTSLYTFTGGTGGSGEIPEAGLIRDSLGNFYGTTLEGGQFGKGTVFELSPEVGGGYNYGLLYNFKKAVGQTYTPVAMDSSGNLFGSVVYGDFQWGMIYELSPVDGGWNFGLVHVFTGGPDGGFSNALLLDSVGNIYGTTDYGANAGCNNNSGCGTLFELVAP